MNLVLKLKLIVTWRAELEKRARILTLLVVFVFGRMLMFSVKELKH